MTTHEDALPSVPAQPVRSLEQHLTRLLYVDGEKLAYIILLVLAVLTRFWDLGVRVMSHDESFRFSCEFQPIRPSLPDTTAITFSPC